LPLGYVDGYPGSSYHAIWAWPDPNRYMLMGSLYSSGVIKDGQAFYCPSQTSEYFQFDTPLNGWDRPYASHKTTRSGYSCRPLYNGDSWHWGSRKSPTPPDNLPRLGDLGNIVVAADIVSALWAVESTHTGGEGINTARLDGSVNWVDRDAYIGFVGHNIASGNHALLWPALDEAN